MFTVVVTFFKATSFVFNFLAWMRKILVLKRKSPHLIFKKKIPGNFSHLSKACTELMTWHFEVVFIYIGKTLIMIHWCTHTPTQLLFRSVTSSFWLEQYSLEENLPGCLQQRNIAHAISFYFLSEAFYLVDIVRLCKGLFAIVYCREQKQTTLALR